MSDSAAQAMQTLTSQFYNALTTQLHLNPEQFQLTQGNVALGNTTTGMWSLMDAIPPHSITQFWTPGNYNSFASNYGGVLSRIHSSQSGAFQAAMGDYYTTWTTYLRSNPPSPVTPANLLSTFQSWSLVNMPPDQAQTAYTLYSASLIDAIGAAQQLWLAAGGQAGVKAYNTTIEQVDNVIAMAPSGAVTLNSQTQSSDVSHTWANGSVEGFYDLFFGAAGASYDAMTTVVTDAGVDMSIQFTHVTTIPISPLASGTIVAGPTTYNAWYVSAALQTAYNNNNFNIWMPGSPDWNSFFGDSGSMPRAASALIVVDGIKVSLNSEASIAEANRQEVQTSFEAGFFPFFGISGSGGWSNSFTYDDQGRISASSSSPVGSPQVLGILVTSIPALITAEAVMAAVRTRRAQRPPRPALPQPQPRAAMAEAPAAALVVTVAWTAMALQGLHNLGVSPQIETLIANHITTWAQGAAGGWMLNSYHSYVSAMPQYTATAQLVAIAGPNRTVNITNFV